MSRIQELQCLKLNFAGIRFHNILFLQNSTKIQPNECFKLISLKLLSCYRFMCKHISELYEVVKTSSCKEKQLDWDAVATRIKDQLQLRAASCIQVASKLVSHYDVSPEWY